MKKTLIALVLLATLGYSQEVVKLTEGIEMRKETLSGQPHRCLDAESFGNLAIKLKDGKTCRQQEVLYKENQAKCDSIIQDVDTLRALHAAHISKKDSIEASLNLNMMRKDTECALKDSIIVNREEVISECEKALDAQGLFNLENILMSIATGALMFIAGLQF